MKQDFENAKTQENIPEGFAEDSNGDSISGHALSTATGAVANQAPSQIKPPENWLRNYLPMGIGQVLSMLGSALVQFALVWYLTKETGSAITLLTATLTGTLPSVFLGPFAGALVDRWNRKLTMIISDGLVALATLVLVVLFATGLIQIWHIYAILFLRSLAGIFQGPAITASLTLMIPREHYTRFAGIQQAVDGIIQIVSPVLGALLFSLLPIQGVLAVDTVTAAIAILLLIFTVKVPQPVRKDEVAHVTPKTILKDVKEGFKYVISWRGILMLIIFGTFINMTIGPAFSLLPLHVQNHFQRGAGEYAALSSSFGVGIIVGGLILGVWGGFKKKVRTIILGLFGMGFGLIIFGLLPSTAFFVAIGVMIFTAIMVVITNGPLNALMKDKIPPEMQGRVFTVMGSMITATVPIGLVIAAPIAETIGIGAWFVIGGGFCFLMALVALLYKPVASLDDQAPGGMLLSDLEKETIEEQL